jgi:hypothetical protein
MDFCPKSFPIRLADETSRAEKLQVQKHLEDDVELQYFRLQKNNKGQMLLGVGAIKALKLWA